LRSSVGERRHQSAPCGPNDSITTVVTDASAASTAAFAVAVNTAIVAANTAAAATAASITNTITTAGKTGTCTHIAVITEA